MGNPARTCDAPRMLRPITRQFPTLSCNRVSMEPRPAPSGIYQTSGTGVPVTGGAGIGTTPPDARPRLWLAGEDAARNTAVEAQRM
ncbi:hypothetical protein SBA3_2750002 [Candidatus Sulfopaludibacter sp. SbA3]|nr:hypothetical protein SBA3_2750002 [Candidatus Sulfopaludibacter sp. SbA3]